MKRLFLIFFSTSYCFSGPYPIQFSISETKIVQKIPEKTRDFAFNIPGHKETYIFAEESDYYKDYQRSYFAITMKKAGWDCMRHYEILANGCIPYFIDLDACDEAKMPFLPRDLIKEAMNLEGVSYPQIDHAKFDVAKYNQILQKLLDYTRSHLTTRAMAKYMLERTEYSGEGDILVLCGHLFPDYLRDSIVIGLKELLGNKVVDYPKIPYIYTSYTKNPTQLYGRGFSYTKILPDLIINRDRIKQRIRNKEFALIIYGSIHSVCPFLNLVKHTYDPHHIIYLCGDDEHTCEYRHLHNLFLREI